MRHFILLFFMLLLFSSCLQNKMAFKQLLKTAMTSEQFKRPLTNAEFQRLMKDTFASPAKTTECFNDFGKILSEKIDKELRSLTNSTCSCQPWGSCTKATCGCEVLCPDNFKIFHNPNVKTGSYYKDLLSFDNYDLDLIKGGSKGYCWGINTVTQKFQRLARFKPSTPSPFPFDGTFNPERKKYLKEIVTKISNNEVVSIPGFDNLFDFSKNPEVKELLMEQVKKEWVQNAMTDQGVRMALKKNSMSIDEFNKFKEDLKLRTANNMSPTLIINYKDQIGAHTIQAMSVKKELDGSEVICIYDNSLSTESSSFCNNIIKVENSEIRMTSRGSVLIENEVFSNKSYNFPISRIEIAHSEDPNTVLQAQALREECSLEKDCPTKQQ